MNLDLRPLHAAVALAGVVVLAGCSSGSEGSTTPATVPSAPATSSMSSMSSMSSTDGHGDHSSGSTTPSASSGHEHAADGGVAPAGIHPASGPRYAVGSTVMLTADHMPGMKGAPATVVGAFDTTTYAVTYTPTTGGAPVKDHKWVVQEELKSPGAAPLAAGTKVVLEADHMPGMKGATATIDSATDETVYMVDVDAPGMQMKNHKWVVESEMHAGH